MADLTIREVPEAGLTALDANFWTAAAAAQTIPAASASERAGGWSNEELFLLCKNSDAATRDVTVGSQTAVTVGAATGNAVIPVRSPGRNGAAIAIVYSATANLSVALVRIGRGY